MAWGSGNLKIRKSEWSIYVPAGLSNLPLFFVGLGLSLFGLLVIYSSSAVLGMQKFDDGLYFVKNQAVFLGLGWIFYFIIAEISVIRLCRYRIAFLFVAVGLLIAVLVPGFGVSAGGAQRWIPIGGFSFQPSEFVRLFLVIYLAGTLAVRQERLHSFNKGFLPLLIVTSTLMLLLILQPDFGGAMSIFVISLAMWFVGGVSLSYLFGLGVLATPALAFVLFLAPYRVKRLMTFLNPWSDPQGSGFQVIQSFVAFFDGGWTGVGLGNSQQKLFYLPEAHTDFIFSVIGEELGVLGASAVVLLFVGVLVCGARIARGQASLVGYLLATGVTIFICIPAIFNMMVAIGLLPTKGMVLPFFSYGRNALLVCLISLGILQSLSKRRHEEAA